MQWWGPKASPSSFVLMPNSNSIESPKAHTHTLSQTHKTKVVSSSPFFNFLLCNIIFFSYLSFFTILNNMVDPKPVLLVLFSPFLLCLFSITNGVQCSSEKVVLSFKEFQWKQNVESPSCLSQKSSECIKRNLKKKG